jgi:hypothetical protein
MYKKAVVLQIAIVFSLLFCSSSNINVRAYNKPTYDIKDSNSIFDVDEKNLVGEIPNSNISLYFVKDNKDFGMYEGFVLQINDEKKYFRWESVDNKHIPKLILSDLDKDGKDELIIILNKGYGTGIKDEEVHIIKQELFLCEVLVENPLITLHKNVGFENSDEQVMVILNNKKTMLSKKKMTSISDQELSSGYGQHVGFEIKNNVLYARILLGVGANSGFGEFIIEYKYKDEIFLAQGIDFVAATEYIY